jgi:hypothetical protein
MWQPTERILMLRFKMEVGYTFDREVKEDERQNKNTFPKKISKSLGRKQPALYGHNFAGYSVGH